MTEYTLYEVYSLVSFLYLLPDFCLPKFDTRSGRQFILSEYQEYLMKNKLLLSDDELDLIHHTFLYVKSLNDSYNQLLDNPTDSNKLFFKNMSISLAIFGHYEMFKDMYTRLSTLHNFKENRD